MVIPVVLCSAEPTADDQRPLIALALSGGGFRAAAFSYGVIQELDRVYLCLIPDEEGKDEKAKKEEPKYKLKFVYHDLAGDTEPENAKADADAKTKCPEDAVINGKLLHYVDFISATSGGAFPAAYYSLYGVDKLRREFPSILGKNIESELLRNLHWFFEPWAFPLRGLLAALDIPVSVATYPLQLLGYPTPSLTGYVVLKGVPGVVNIREVERIYDQAILGGRFLGGKRFGDIRTLYNRFSVDDDSLLTSGKKADNLPKPLKESKLLIHATDLNNQRIFTFDWVSIECLLAQTMDQWRDRRNFESFPIAAALAATTGLPGIFEPYRLKPTSRPEFLPKVCSKFYDDRVHSEHLSLIDGGVYENLSIEGLMPYLFKQKRLRGGERRQMIIIVVNAEVPSLLTTGGGSLVETLNQSFDSLTTQRSELSLSLYKALFPLFGINIVELSFKGLLNEPRVVQPEEGDIAGLFSASKAEAKLLNDINSIGTSLSLTQAQRDTLVGAARRLVRGSLRSKDEVLRCIDKTNAKQVCAGEAAGEPVPMIERELVRIFDREFRAGCRDVFINSKKKFCWPTGWDERLYQLPFKARLDELWGQLRGMSGRRRLDEAIERAALDQLLWAVRSTKEGDTVWAIDYAVFPWTKNDRFREYQEANLDAARDRKVKIERLFVFSEQIMKDETQLSDMIKIMKDQADAEITVKIARKEQLEKSLEEDQEKEGRPRYEFKNGMILFDYRDRTPLVIEEQETVDERTKLPISGYMVKVGGAGRPAVIREFMQRLFSSDLVCPFDLGSDTDSIKNSIKKWAEAGTPCPVRDNTVMQR